jgi:hypothetical protein
MKRTLLRLLLAALALGLSLAACAPEPTTEADVTPTSTATPTPTPTPGPAATTEPTATATEQPGGMVITTPTTPPPTEVPPPCTDYELEIDYCQLMEIEAGPLRDEISYSGSIPFSADLSTDPVALRGGARFDVRGEGSAGECTWVHTGTTDVTLSGSLVTDASGERKLQIHLDIRWEEHEVVGTSGECTGLILGGLQAPVDTAAERELPYEDGYTVSWPVAFEGAPLTGESSWTLHILCE